MENLVMEFVACHTGMDDRALGAWLVQRLRAKAGYNGWLAAALHYEAANDETQNAIGQYGGWVCPGHCERFPGPKQLQADYDSLAIAVAELLQ